MKPLDAERWRHIEPLLDRAFELSPDERRAWLDAVCAADPAMREEIERLLAADARTGGVLDTGPDLLLRPLFDDIDRSDRARAARFIPGATLAGRYRIVTLLGRGGMGEVYRADDLKLGQSVALKFLPWHLAQSAGLRTSLVRETRIARQVSHPNVCRVYDISDAQGHTFLTMEYIDGEDLRSLIGRIGRLPHQKALDIARQLCAGLQAAHDLGILHRDLKPANVMIDARGRARITDFGIAAATTEDRAAPLVAGTPAYMAPELLDGNPATATSDIYALGLVLYELFTGTRPFDAVSVEDLRRQHANATVRRPGAVVAHLDARIDRAILACLEHDSELRPRSARAVATLLPGGDPIAAAVEAGETPSPELVAASGPQGFLDRRAAIGLFAATIAMCGVLLALADRVSVLGWVSFPHGVATLERQARSVLNRLGHTAAPADWAASLNAGNSRYRQFVRAYDQSHDRWNELRADVQWDVMFWYRQSQNPLRPANGDGIVRADDPAPQSGDAQVLTDARGRLIWLRVFPEEAEPPGIPNERPDWAALFREAGLDPSAFHSTEPTRNPNVTADLRAAWLATESATGGYPVRVEAAAHRGRPVYFEQVVPWDPYWDPSSAPHPSTFNPSTSLMFRVLATVCMVAMPLAVIGFVGRSWLSGRGDRGGAVRLAALIAALRFATWLSGAHHVQDLRDEWILFTIAAGRSLVDGVAAGALYLAVEPYARRLHPRFLVSWMRLLRGKVRDPLVGRDIAVGIALSTVTVLCAAYLPLILSYALQQDAPPPPMFHPLGNLPYLYILNPPAPQPLLGGRHAIAALLSVALTTFGITLTFLVVLLALNILLRRAWLALVVFAGIIAAVNPIAEATDYALVSIVLSIVATLALMWTLRFGLMGWLAHWFGALMWMNFPMTVRPDAPHFAVSLFGVAVIAGVALYGVVTAGRRPDAPAIVAI